VRANADDDRTDSDTDATAHSGSTWFSLVARALLGKDAGLHLHLLTGFPERTCYRYTARDNPRDPPTYLLRRLLHSEQGWIWFEATMDGCDAEWWRDLQKARRIAKVIRDEQFE
jgi:hypothetical protein